MIQVYLSFLHTNIISILCPKDHHIIIHCNPSYHSDLTTIVDQLYHHLNTANIGPSVAVQAVHCSRETQ